MAVFLLTETALVTVGIVLGKTDTTTFFFSWFSCTFKNFAIMITFNDYKTRLFPFNRFKQATNNCKARAVIDVIV